MEYKTIFRKRIFKIVILGIFIFQALYSAYWFSAYRIDKEENYIDRYYENAENTINQADGMSGISIFAPADEYSNKNINKTKNDYMRLMNIKPVDIDYTGLQSFFKYKLINWFGIILAVIIALAHRDEALVGLNRIIYASKEGRGIRSFRKISSLFMWSGVMTFALYGGDMLLSSGVNKTSFFSILKYPVQSIPLFMNFTYKLSIGGFIGSFLLCRWLVFFCLTLVIWWVYYFIDNMLISSAVLVTLTIIEVLPYSLLGQNSSMCILKYCNIWYLLKDNSLFTEYLNLNIFSSPVDKTVVALISMIICCAVLTVLAIIRGHLAYPVSEKRGLKNIKLFCVLQEHLGNMGYEVYKLLIAKKGIWLLICILIIFVKQTDSKGLMLAGYQEMYYTFIDEYEGVPSEASDNEIYELGELLDNLDAEFAETEAAYEAGKMDVETYVNKQMTYSAYETERIFYARIVSQREYLSELKSEKNVDGWYVNLYCYNRLFENEVNVENIAFVIVMLLLAAGLFWEEKVSGMDVILRTCKCGRGQLDRRKAGLLVFLAATFILLKNLLKIYAINKMYGISGVIAPVWSIPALSKLPFNCSILQFIISYMLVEMIVLMTIIIIALFVMKKIRNSRFEG
jgi:hypothetical protein